MSNTKAARPAAAVRGGDDDGAMERVGDDLDLDHVSEDGAEGLHEFSDLVRRQLSLLGESPEREGLLATPLRVAKSLTWLTRGYGMTAAGVVGDAVFTEAHENMVMVRDIEVYSLCEHHLLPFFGKAHVGYLPRGRIIGLSKIPRIVDMFARRLQVQERMTRQIADFITDLLEPQGVAVVIEAVHLCARMRGVKNHDVGMTTSTMEGSFRTNPATRQEFLDNISRTAAPFRL